MSTSFVPLSTSGNGSIYNSGFVAQQQQAVAQNNINNAARGTTGGKRSKRNKRGKRSKRSKRSIYRGGAVATPLPVAYSDGNGINNAYKNFLEVSAQSRVNATGDSAVTKGGSKRRHTHKRRRTHMRRNKSRRHK